MCRPSRYKDATVKMSTELQRYSLNGETMGTRYPALFYAGSGMDTDAVGRSLACAVARVDQPMSIWTPDSDLNRPNSPPELPWASAHQDLVALQLVRPSF